VSLGFDSTSSTAVRYSEYILCRMLALRGIGLSVGRVSRLRLLFTGEVRVMKAVVDCWLGDGGGTVGDLMLLLT